MYKQAILDVTLDLPYQVDQEMFTSLVSIIK